MDKNAFAPIVKGKRIILVGPGASVLEDCKSINVDSYDLVCRFNWHWKHTNPLLGARTDMIFHCLNPTQYKAKDIQEWKDNKIQIVSVHDMDFYNSKDPRSTRSAKTQEFIRRRGEVNLDVYCVTQAENMKWRKLLGCNPNTGVIAILHLLTLDIESVSAVGFDFYDTLYFHKENAKMLDFIVKRTPHQPKKQLHYFKQHIKAQPKFIPLGKLERIINNV